MTPEQQIIAIAEACGWKMSTELIKHTDDYPWTEKRTFWISPSGERGSLPNYFNDLNAMHKAEKTLHADGGLWGGNIAAIPLKSDRGTTQSMQPQPNAPKPFLEQ